eukprot:TRINITY_DN10366_c0_g1_i1.p1 TRINITY_DN10366_c0_g1~~TRINITY_DN10366_c0_g1_i1.p1  ORF type:complete len:173 (+),score=36.19 TRINITY_DN10366_c0_g1_i1:92-610(+)
MQLAGVQQTSGGMGFNQQVRVGFNSSNVGAQFPFTLSVTPKFDDASAVKVWAVEAGPYGLPSKAAAKMAPSASVSDLYAALQQFVEEQCANAGAGMSGQMNQHLMGRNVGQIGMSVTWTPVVNKLTFEGDEVPNSFEAVSSFLKDGEMFQATGVTRQEVNMQRQKRCSCCIL